MTTNCASIAAAAYWQNASFPAPQIDPTERMRFFFSLQSSRITFSEWIWLLTLALAPLLAHVFVGGPTIVRLDPRQPRWLDIACLYNPTTIVWRYYAIAVRRATTPNWSSYDAAAANSAFWTGNSWESSQIVAEDARPCCIHVPRHTHINLMSKSAAQTTIVALQGAQTLADFAKGFQEGDSGEELAVPTIFAFITLIGLYRLTVAPWLVDDFHYVDVESDRVLASSLDTKCKEDIIIRPSIASDPINILRLWSIRTFFFAPLMIQLVMTILTLVPFPGKGLIYTATCTALTIFSIYLLFGTLCAMLWQFFKQQDGHIVLPAVNTGLYKAYTISIFAGLLALLVIAGLETRRTFCGVYTTFPAGLGLDALLCKRISYI
ncbi:hypothetical protein GQ44DRAFT_503021 [Phaeosphaeriaceae sp. PMI808]|nr:hypothetical protein GQ44DRAFT_503021 [Phaeosphaeriaceae sp. PMI808]